MVDVQIVLPPRASSRIDLSLVRLTRYLIESGKVEDPECFGLGGSYGYGVKFENDVFMLHPYCWCEKKDCLWCASWDSGEGREEAVAAALERYGDAARVDEPYAPSAPNFYHKPSGFGIQWYKWIGRSMEFSREVTPTEWRAIYRECIASLRGLESGSGIIAGWRSGISSGWDTAEL